MAEQKELSQEELEAFNKWKASRETRKVAGTAKRKALADLKKAHKAEYDAGVKKYGG